MTLSLQSVVMAPPSFLILVICVFSLPFLISITRGLIIFNDLFKEPTFYYIEKFFLVSISVLQIRSSIPCFPGGSVVENLPAMWETQVGSLGWEDPLEKGMATHCSTLAWRIPWTEESERLKALGSHRVRHD